MFIQILLTFANTYHKTKRIFSPYACVGDLAKLRIRIPSVWDVNNHEDAVQQTCRKRGI